MCLGASQKRCSSSVLESVNFCLLVKIDQIYILIASAAILQCIHLVRLILTLNVVAKEGVPHTLQIIHEGILKTNGEFLRLVLEMSCA